MMCLRIFAPYCRYKLPLRRPFLFPFPFARDHSQSSFLTASSSVINIIEYLLVPMCGIHDCFDGIEICIAHSLISQPSSIWNDSDHCTGKWVCPVPMLLPKSVAWNTLMLKSCCTLPTTSAALLSWRCASCCSNISSHPGFSKSLASFSLFSSSPLPYPLLSCPLLIPLVPTDYEQPLSRSSVHTRFRCKFILPFASIVAVSPRRDTTLPRMRTV